MSIKKLKSLLRSKDTELARIVLERVEVNGKEARAEKIGEPQEVLSVASHRVYIVNGRHIDIPKGEALEVGSDQTFSVSRDCGNGVTEKRFYRLEHSPYGVQDLHEDDEDEAEAPGTAKVNPAPELVQPPVSANNKVGQPYEPNQPKRTLQDDINAKEPAPGFGNAPVGDGSKSAKK